MEEQKKNMLSLIQPTNTPHLGNYLGAMQNWVKLQNDYNCYFGIADLHSITVRQDPVKLRNQIKESYALLIAAGLDPEKSTLFVQGHNPNRRAKLDPFLLHPVRRAFQNDAVQG